MKTRNLKQAHEVIDAMIHAKEEEVLIMEHGIKEAHWYLLGLKDALKALEARDGAV